MSPHEELEDDYDTIYDFDDDQWAELGLNGNEHEIRSVSSALTDQLLTTAVEQDSSYINAIPISVKGLEFMQDRDQHNINVTDGIVWWQLVESVHRIRLKEIDLRKQRNTRVRDKMSRIYQGKTMKKNMFKVASSSSS